MNEEAIRYAFELFTKDGYNGSKEDYIELVNSNPEALSHSFKLFSDDGYNGSPEDFASLIGVKKKDDSEAISTEKPMVSVTPTQEEPGLSESSQGDGRVSVYQPYPINPQTGEKDTAIERWFGKNEITDFFGDIYRAGEAGQKPHLYKTPCFGNTKAC